MLRPLNATTAADPAGNSHDHTGDSLDSGTGFQPVPELQVDDAQDQEDRSIKKPARPDRLGCDPSITGPWESSLADLQSLPETVARYSR